MINVCGKKLTQSDWAGLGVDIGTVFHNATMTSKDIIALGKQLSDRFT